MLTPLVGTIEALGAADVPIGVLAEQYRRSVRARGLRDAAQGRHSADDHRRPPLPKLAEFYYREVLSRIIAAVRALLERAAARGEVPQGSG